MRTFQTDASLIWLTNWALFIGKTKGKGTFGKVKQGTHDPTNEKVFIWSLSARLSSNRRFWFLMQAIWSFIFLICWFISSRVWLFVPSYVWMIYPAVWFFLIYVVRIGRYQNSRERKDQGPCRLGANKPWDNHSQESPTSKCCPTLWCKFVCVPFSGDDSAEFRWLKTMTTCTWSWSIVRVASFSSTLWRIEGWRSLKLVRCTPRFSQVLNTSTSLALCTVISSQRIYSLTITIISS